MRRTLPHSLVALSPNQVHKRLGDVVWSCVLPLRTITPVVGGGVMERWPDPVSPVRVTGIRGQLRAWWRLTQPLDIGADDLFRQERLIFGAAAKHEPNSRDRDGQSNVTLRGVVIKAPRFEAAGVHKVHPKDGRMRLIPDMSEIPTYGAFPLYRNKDQLESAVRRGVRRLETPPVVRDLEFDLHIHVRRKAIDSLDKLKEALALWITFGGIGARTRRGFGALALRAPIADDVLPEMSKPQNLLGFIRRGSPELVELDFQSAAAAQKFLLDSLQTFRQGPGFARDKGSGNRPGVSFWPEADSMKLAAVRAGVVSSAQQFDHKIRMLPPQASPPFPAPRAAFGMPLRIAFKKDKENVRDAEANGEIRPKGKPGNRMPSPLIFSVTSARRPNEGERTGERYLAVALKLPLPAGPKVVIALDSASGKKIGGKETDAVIGLGAGLTLAGPIGDWVKGAANDAALKGFLDWMEKSRNFRRYRPPAKAPKTNQSKPDQSFGGTT